MAVDLFIEGTPYCQRKSGGDIKAPVRWTEAVKQATKNLPKVKDQCYMIVVFVLPEDKYPSDHPYGPDLDNLIQPLFNALNDTVFSEVSGNDGSVVQLVVSKRKAMRNEPPGARVIIADRGD